MADLDPSVGKAGKRSGRRQRHRASARKGRGKQPTVRPTGVTEGATRVPEAATNPAMAGPVAPEVPALDPVAVVPADVPADSGRSAISRAGFGWTKPMPFHRQAYAAIDLGTNNCRLLIARPSGDHFVVIDAFSRVVRLGEGLAQSGRLSDAAMDRAVAALQICADKLRKRNVHLARSVATEACRRASNGAAFIDRVRRETGIRLDIISAQEEARLAVLGCHILLEHGEGPAMIFDIGGGSTEMVLVDPSAAGPVILDWQSVPWGVVSLTESIGPIADSAEARADAYAEMRRIVGDAFAGFTARITDARDLALGQGPVRLLGTSGTVTTLASLHLGLPQYDRSLVDGVFVPTDSMRAISRRLAECSPVERIAVPCIGRERADLVVAGCAILETIFDIWPATKLGIADRGIREGILRSLMANASEAERLRQASRRSAQALSAQQAPQVQGDKA